MSSKGLDKSAASTRVKSRVGCLKVYLGKDNANIQMTKDQAARLACNLLMLSQDEEVQGYIILGAFSQKPDITVLGRKSLPKRADSRHSSADPL